MESPKVASAAGGDASSSACPSHQSHACALGVPAPTRRAPGAGTLGDAAQSLLRAQVLVQLGAQLGQLSPAGPGGGLCGESWARGKVGRGVYRGGCWAGRKSGVRSPMATRQSTRRWGKGRLRRGARPG